MKTKMTMTLAATSAVALLAGCGTSTRTVYVSQHKHTGVSPVPSASPSATPASVTNERLLADGLATVIPTVPSHVVAGPLMRAYVRFEHAYGAGWSAAGQPYTFSNASPVPGGFKLCWSNADGASGCDTLAQFSTNSAGQITGVSVNGQPVAGRIATAPAATSGGLRISNVVAYQVTDAQSQVAVAFKLTDSGYRPVNTSPSLLASLNGASDDTSEDALPSTLAPGDALYAVAGFDIPQITGLFCLEPNDGFGEHLPCTTLSKV